MDNQGYSGEPSNGDVTKVNSEKAMEASGSGDNVPDNVSVTLTTGEVKEPATKPYAGMGKEDLLRFSQTPFWNRMRMGCVVLFWLIWIGLLIAVVVLTIVMPRCTAPRDKDWWEKTVFYQVYVRSFYDSDGDGVGDIKGVIQKLDHIEYMNVDTLILSSFYLSHTNFTDTEGKQDFGYDVVDHKAIDSQLGNMTDFEELVEEMHARGMKLLIDFVPNHTGDRHPWFTESAADQADRTDKWNYYVWEDCGTGDTGDLPTNWLSIYGQSAWNYSATAGRCYLHQFFDWQPELNLRSTQVMEELDDILQFWLEKNVDGFRVNSVKYLFEDNDQRDEEAITDCDDTENPYNCFDHKYTTSQPEIYAMVDRWRRILERFSDETGQYRILLTDAQDTVNHTMRYYGDGGKNGAHLPINYQLTSLRPGMGGHEVEDLVDWWIYNQPLDTTADWLTGHQDEHRMGDWMEPNNTNMALMVQLTLPGTTITYYGEELGMVDGNLTDDQDPAGAFNEDWSRDPYRTPMQWSDEEWAGFTNASAVDDTYDPWIQPNMDYHTRNVEAQKDITYSPLRIYQRLCEMHRDEEGLHHGNMHYALIDENVFSYIRFYEGYDYFLVAANFGTEEATFNFHDAHYMVPSKAEVVFRTEDDIRDFVEGEEANMKEVFLRPGEGAIFSWPYTR